MQSEQSTGLLSSLDQLLSNDVIQAFFLVNAVLMLIGLGTVAVLVWRHVPLSWWPKVSLQVALFFGGIDLSVTAYETYHIVQIVNAKSKTSWDSQKIKTLFQTIDKTSQTAQATSLAVAALSQTVEATSQKAEALSKTAEETSGTVKEIFRIINNPKCLSHPCRHKTDRSTCSSNTSMTVSPSQADSAPSPSAASTLEADGWVYVGTRSGQKWDEKYFECDGDTECLPKTGDTLIATGSVHLREALGCRAPIVGAIAPGGQVSVLQARIVADCHHWVQVKRVQEKEH